MGITQSQQIEDIVDGKWIKSILKIPIYKMEIYAMTQYFGLFGGAIVSQTSFWPCVKKL